MMRSCTAPLLAITLVVTLSFAALLAKNALAASGVSPLISYQGRLTDTSGNPRGGSGTNYCMRFSIYDAASAGNKLWPAGTPTANTISVANGVFTADIGAADSLASYDFSSNATQYLQVEVYNVAGANCSSPSGGSWEALSPRQLLDAVPYARVASSVNSNVMQALSTSGTVQIGTGVGASTPIFFGLDVRNVADTVGGTCSQSGTLWYNSGNGRTLVCNNGIVQIVGSALNNQFFDVAGPSGTVKTFTFPNQNATVLTDAVDVTVAQGGTGLSALTAGSVLVGAGTSAVSLIAPGTAGNVLRSNGTTWASADIANQAFASGAGTCTDATSGTAKMMGFNMTYTTLAAGNTSGTARVSLNFQITGPATNGVNTKYKVFYGTGTAPACNATATGTGVGNQYTQVSQSTTAGAWPQRIDVVVSGLAAGTTYWFDVQATDSSTASWVYSLPQMSVTEL
ncbi:MAG TPA: hypothetical protein VF803_03140 [Candidatus Paceibacterota bacterium]